MATPEPTSSSSSKSSTVATSPQPPPQASSPRFNVFHRHFHSKSSPDMPSTEIEPGVGVVSAPARTEAIRDAKRFVLSTVRDDWSFPPAQSPPPSEEEPREPLDYRYREEGSSDVEADSEGPAGDPYRFENPDAIALTVQDRRRKRRRLLQEEMQWNIGLRTWSRRRDAWTGAVWERPRQPRRSDGRQGPSISVLLNAG